MSKEQINVSVQISLVATISKNYFMTFNLSYREHQPRIVCPNVNICPTIVS